MSLAQIQSLPQTSEEFAGWSFANMAHHRDIIRVVFNTQQKRLDEYFIDDFNQQATNDTNWLYLHSIMHNQMNAALGVSGYDLTTLDWQDEENVANWFNQHADEHFQAAQILGVS